MTNQYYESEEELLTYMTEKEKEKYAKEVENCREIGVTHRELFDMYSRMFCDRKLGYRPEMMQTVDGEVVEEPSFKM